MKLSAVFLTLLSVFLIIKPTEESIGFHDVLDIASVTKDVVIWIAKAWNIVDDQIDFDIPPPLLEKTEKKLFKRIDHVNVQLAKISEKIDTISAKSTAAILRNLPKRIRFELRLNDLLDGITGVEIYFSRMQNYMKLRDDLERSTLKSFANGVVSHTDDAIAHKLDEIYRYIVPTGKGIVNTDILHTLADILEEVEGDMLCNIQQSPQQVIFSLYNAIALTELKGYAMIQFAYMLKKLYGEGNFTVEAQIARNEYYSRTNNITAAVRSAMKLTSKDLWRCDPKKHVLGETYEELTQLLQGYIQNEVDLNSEGTCRENCAEYTYTKSHGCFQNLYCKKQRRCNGKIINCRFVDSDMWICGGNDGNKRRYEYVEYESGRVLGRKQSCKRGTTKVDSWWRWLFWHCSYCLCLCDEQGPYSDRYVNLRESVADVKENMVVTGLRFVKHNRIIHLQIQQGKLLARGNIDNATVGWKNVSDYKITDANVYNGLDYHMMSWEKRAMDLDDLVADKGQVVTGVRFKVIGSHVNFEILVTPFDFETGRLIDPLSKSVYKDNPNTDSSLKNPRKMVYLANPDIPIRSPAPSLPDSANDQYIEFVNTDFDRDAAQTTVPFFDAQKVESVQAVPLMGAGIFHKGRPNFGGFVAPKIITYDFSDHLQPFFPEQEEPLVN